VKTWTRDEWQTRRDAHLARVEGLAHAFLRRRSRGEKHPVEDFLFTYYQLPPTRLIEWFPPLHTAIEVRADDLESMPWLQNAPHLLRDGLWSLDPAQVTPRIRELAAWIAQLCQNILARPPRLRCYGLHEWAMVYQQTAEQVRHSGYTLRMPPEQLATFIDSQNVCCSHYDAFRFFTPAAKPLNALQPVLETRLELEQGGCLHTNMDLYKWSAKLLPWCGSDLVSECFLNAWQGRQLDMRASPYELTALGYTPVKIETPEGRAEYECEQRRLAEAAVPLREKLRQVAAELAKGEFGVPASAGKIHV